MFANNVLNKIVLSTFCMKGCIIDRVVICVASLTTGNVVLDFEFIFLATIEADYAAFPTSFTDGLLKV